MTSVPFPVSIRLKLMDGTTQDVRLPVQIWATRADAQLAARRRAARSQALYSYDRRARHREGGAPIHPGLDFENSRTTAELGVWCA